MVGAVAAGYWRTHARSLHSNPLCDNRGVRGRVQASVASSPTARVSDGSGTPGATACALSASASIIYSYAATAAAMRR